MKATDIKLIVAMVIAIVGSGLCAKKLVSMQEPMNRPNRVLKHSSKMPIAGFQKFMADIVWMRFINYAGTNALTKENKGTYKYYIDTIIALDPDFFEIYQWGAMFLQQVDLEMALGVIDKAQQNPRINDRHELPLLAGQMLMQSEWNKFYAGNEKDIDTEVVARARKYYRDAKSCSDATASCLGGYIRASALLMENTDPKKINELRAWKEYFEENMAVDGMEGGMGEMGEATVDVENRLLSQIKYLAEDYAGPAAEQKDPETKKKAVELIKSVIDTFFPGRPFDMESFKPYNTGSLHHIGGTIAMPMDKTYVVELESPHAFALEHATFKLAKGTATVTVLVDGKPVDGLTDVTVGTERISVPAVVELKKESEGSETTVVSLISSPPLGFTLRQPLANHKGKVGSVVEIKVTKASGVEGLSYKITSFVGDYF